MAQTVEFQGINTKFVATKDANVERGVGSLFAFNNGLLNISCWQLDPAELAEVVRTGKVWLSVMSGKAFFPSFVGSESTVRAASIDFGKPLPRQGEVTPGMKLVIIESPYAGNGLSETMRNVEYARRAVADSLRRGEAPIASHLLYTQEGILDDTVPAERTLGIEAGLAWGRMAELTAVYADRGISRGMELGIERAEREGRAVEIRRIEQ